MCTDISKDGMLQGPSLDLYKAILGKTEVKLIASGGISSISDVKAVGALGCEGVVIGKAIYENRISLKELMAYA
jgi:phosphoribosylformimino-5-aminoimidazole carboxamide ribotide isomerase